MKSLCVCLTKEGREFIKNKRESVFGSQMDVSWATGISQINISRWERGVYCPRYFAFRSYLSHLKIKKGFFKNKKYVSGTKPWGFKIKKILSSKLSKEKAYALGVLGPGDGFLFDYGLDLNVIDKDFADYFQYCLEKVFGLKCCRYKRITPPTDLVKVSSKQYVVILCSKAAASSIKSYKASFREMVWNVPKKIKEASKSHKAAYLCGVFDSQGTVNGKQLKLGIKNKKGLKEIMVLLEDLEIKSGITDGGYRIFISGEKRLKLYDRLIGFKIKRKSDKLKKSLAGYKHSCPTKEDVEKAMPMILKLKNEGLSYNKIAIATGIGRGAVRNNLRRFEK